MLEARVRRVINNLIKLYKDNPRRWTNEREAHYDFFRLLFDEFTADEIKQNFMWEYSVGIPAYGTGRKSAAIDLVIKDNSGKWIAVEIEAVGPGMALENELTICLLKLKTTTICQQYMQKGFIVPLLARVGDKLAKGYGKPYAELCQDILDRTEADIGESPIELIREGVLLG